MVNESEMKDTVTVCKLGMKDLARGPHDYIGVFILPDQARFRMDALLLLE